MNPGRYRFAGAIALALAAFIVLLAVRLLAAGMTAHYLANQAARTEAKVLAGKPLWHWQPRKPDDLIAGRAFGNAHLQPVYEGLQVTSDDGSPFDLGLPIATGLDLQHWPQLVLRLRGETPADLKLVWQGIDGPTCMADAGSLTTNQSVRIDLRLLTWQPTTNGHCALPSSALMLRLRLTLPPRTSLIVSSVALERDASPTSPHAREFRISPQTLPNVLARLSSSSTATPLLRLPSTSSAEAMLRIRDEVARIRPGALLMVGDSAVPTEAPKRLPAWIGWLAAASYVAALALLARRKRAAWIELLGALLGPLWLIAGLQWEQRPSLPGALAFISALLFAAFLQWRQRPVTWRWFGHGRHLAWWAPMALIPAAVGVGLMFGHHFDPISPRRVPVYLAWAMLQQWLILGFAMPRLERLLPRPSWAVLAAATIFALMHTPNGLLMQLCFAAELWFGVCFARTRSLFPVAMAHTAAALLVGASLVGGPLRSLEVSARFFL